MNFSILFHQFLAILMGNMIFETLFGFFWGTRVLDKQKIIGSIVGDITPLCSHFIVG